MSNRFFLLAPAMALAPLAWPVVSLAAEVPLDKLPRHALVIGNSRYPVAELINPRNDAMAIAERLRLAGFSVALKLDVGRIDMQDAIRDFGRHLARDKGVGVFYYAGHGVQLNWRNFLLPVDAKIRGRADVQPESVDLGILLDALGRARNPLNLIILDACRNNPFGSDFRVDDKGLSMLDAPPGTLLAYATAPGNTAEDGEGTHGLYTGRLLKEMQQPGAAVEDVFKRVRLAVRRDSQGAQIPWESTSLEADFAFLPARSRPDAGKEFAADLAAWQQLRQAATIEQLEAFIRQRPSGKFAELALFQLTQLLAAKGEQPVRPRVAAGEACSLPQPVYAGAGQPFRIGESYTYRSLNLLTHAETRRFTQQVAQIERDEVAFDDGKTVVDLFGNNVRAPDGRRWTPYQFFIDEYQVGKRWPAQFIVSQADGKENTVGFELRVAARERITLPAGTFDAFRIEARGQDSNGNTLERSAWVAPERMRGFLAMEQLTRRDGKLIEGERIELQAYSYRPPAAAPTLAPAKSPERPAWSGDY